MSWVDYAADVRWSRSDLERQARAVITQEFPDAQDLVVLAGQLASGNGYMTTEQRSRWDAYTARKSEMASLVQVEMGRMRLLSDAMAVETAQHALRFVLPSLDPADPAHDEREAARAAQQAVVDAAAPEVKTLVSLRARIQPQQQEVAP